MASPVVRICSQSLWSHFLIKCGNPCVISAEVTGDPTPTVTWYIDLGEKVVDGGRFRRQVEDGGRIHLLIIEEVNEELDNRLVTIFASNSLGWDTSMVDLKTFRVYPKYHPLDKRRIRATIRSRGSNVSLDSIQVAAVRLRRQCRSMPRSFPSTPRRLRKSGIRTLVRSKTWIAPRVKFREDCNSNAFEDQKTKDCTITKRKNCTAFEGENDDAWAENQLVNNVTRYAPTISPASSATASAVSRSPIGNRNSHFSYDSGFCEIRRWSTAASRTERRSKAHSSGDDVFLESISPNASSSAAATFRKSCELQYEEYPELRSERSFDSGLGDLGENLWTMMAGNKVRDSRLEKLIREQIEGIHSARESEGSQQIRKRYRQSSNVVDNSCAIDDRNSFEDLLGSDKDTNNNFESLLCVQRQFLGKSRETSFCDSREKGVETVGDEFEAKCNGKRRSKSLDLKRKIKLGKQSLEGHNIQKDSRHQSEQISDQERKGSRVNRAVHGPATEMNQNSRNQNHVASSDTSLFASKSLQDDRRSGQPAQKAEVLNNESRISASVGDLKDCRKADSGKPDSKETTTTALERQTAVNNRSPTTRAQVNPFNMDDLDPGKIEIPCDIVRQIDLSKYTQPLPFNNISSFKGSGAIKPDGIISRNQKDTITEQNMEMKIAERNASDEHSSTLEQQKEKETDAKQGKSQQSEIQRRIFIEVIDKYMTKKYELTIKFNRDIEQSSSRGRNCNFSDNKDELMDVGKPDTFKTTTKEMCKNRWTQEKEATDSSGNNEPDDGTIESEKIDHSISLEKPESCIIEKQTLPAKQISQTLIVNINNSSVGSPIGYRRYLNYTQKALKAYDDKQLNISAIPFTYEHEQADISSDARENNVQQIMQTDEGDDAIVMDDVTKIILSFLKTRKNKQISETEDSGETARIKTVEQLNHNRNDENQVKLSLKDQLQSNDVKKALEKSGVKQILQNGNSQQRLWQLKEKHVFKNYAEKQKDFSDANEQVFLKDGKEHTYNSNKESQSYNEHSPVEIERFQTNSTDVDETAENILRQSCVDGAPDPLKQGGLGTIRAIPVAKEAFSGSTFIADSSVESPKPEKSPSVNRRSYRPVAFRPLASIVASNKSAVRLMSFLQERSASDRQSTILKQHRQKKIGAKQGKLQMSEIQRIIFIEVIDKCMTIIYDLTSKLIRAIEQSSCIERNSNELMDVGKQDTIEITTKEMCKTGSTQEREATDGGNNEADDETIESEMIDHPISLEKTKICKIEKQKLPTKQISQMLILDINALNSDNSSDSSPIGYRRYLYDKQNVFQANDNKQLNISPTLSTREHEQADISSDAREQQRRDDSVLQMMQGDVGADAIVMDDATKIILSFLRAHENMNGKQNSETEDSGETAQIKTVKHLNHNRNNETQVKSSLKDQLHCNDTKETLENYDANQIQQNGNCQQKVRDSDKEHVSKNNAKTHTNLMDANKQVFQRNIKEHTCKSIKASEAYYEERTPVEIERSLKNITSVDETVENIFRKSCVDGVQDPLRQGGSSSTEAIPVAKEAFSGSTSIPYGSVDLPKPEKSPSVNRRSYRPFLLRPLAPNAAANKFAVRSMSFLQDNPREKSLHLRSTLVDISQNQSVPLDNSRVIEINSVNSSPQKCEEGRCLDTMSENCTLLQDNQDSNRLQNRGILSENISVLADTDEDTMREGERERGKFEISANMLETEGNNRKVDSKSAVTADHKSEVISTAKDTNCYPNCEKQINHFVPTFSKDILSETTSQQQADKRSAFVGFDNASHTENRTRKDECDAPDDNTEITSPEMEFSTCVESGMKTERKEPEHPSASLIYSTVIPKDNSRQVYSEAEMHLASGLFQSSSEVPFISKYVIEANDTDSPHFVPSPPDVDNYRDVGEGDDDDGYLSRQTDINDTKKVENTEDIQVDRTTVYIAVALGVLAIGIVAIAAIMR